VHPSLRPNARAVSKNVIEAAAGRLIETGLAPDALPGAAPYTLEQTLDPEFLPD
jgi:hypothetical protein